MSLQDLVGGECGAPNPLMQLLQHFTDDKSRMQERASSAHQREYGASSSRGHQQQHVPPHQRAAEAMLRQRQEDLRLLRRGIVPPSMAGLAPVTTQSPHQHQPYMGGAVNPDAFQFDQVWGSLNEIEQAQWQAEFESHEGMAAAFETAWHVEQHRQMDMHMRNKQLEQGHHHQQQHNVAAESASRAPIRKAWEEEFSKQSETFDEFERLYASSSGSSSSASHQARPADAVGSWLNDFDEGTTYQAPEAATSTSAQSSSTAAADAADSELARTARSLLYDVNDPKLKNSRFMGFLRRIAGGELEVVDNEVRETGKTAAAAAAEGSAAQGDWAAEFGAGAHPGKSRDAWADEFAPAAPRGDVEADSGFADWAAEFSQKAKGKQPAGRDSAFDEEDTVDLDDQDMEWLKSFSESDEWANLHGAAGFEATKSQEWEDEFSVMRDRLLNKQTGQEYGGENGLASDATRSRTNYQFASDNPFVNLPNAMEEGRKLLANGDLAEAILAFEAAALRDPGSAEAWLLIGTSQAENEQDLAAIAALRKCTELDRTNPAAWLALSVCYTNESLFDDAYASLESWIDSSDRYRHLLQEVKTDDIADSPESEEAVQMFLQGVRPVSPRHKRICNVLIAAALQGPAADTGAHLDADVQNGLGVLFNISREYDKAVDCFRAALETRPDDFNLWNRLGATLANSTQSEEAVHAYFSALRLRPGFIRARYNLGISCINLNAYKEAVEHFLSALAMQKTHSASHSHMSDSIWNTLRMTAVLMARGDLLEAIERRDLEAFQGQFDF
ncbi:peroxisomal biogenesis factor 5 [Capsaspora owczarzaki ATCC 30864]|uniref:Peroxisomal biogenesis factor 5 n=1 Tax=Capsaspora owczarzaki (strain ATCC 30864) TaxID=595528 RepID=A0A0D2X482_CAPO3|nr:peroxisomal biogenesis factor 5 [Capsaspora owczarzaki ATCC 30864]KJE95604.1 peroxisomal biogenesis factor 5 [Capsaspora owczarzaki ATCC 30864]|eukprot:XP_004345630.1 peroxisomal biogenesis factor 5 [Capsaspora owczarzaki ATCC 30864]